ncbi:MAG: hypothetical protein RCG16_08850 [Rickettsia hoogstraalii]
MQLLCQVFNWWVNNIGKFLHYSKLTNSMCLKDFGISDYSELMELAIIEKGYMNAVQGNGIKFPFLNI